MIVTKVDDSHQSPTSQVQKCYRPLEKQCSGEGPEECRDYPETICTTRYIKKASGKFVQVNRSIKCKQLHWNECTMYMNMVEEDTKVCLGHNL